MRRAILIPSRRKPRRGGGFTVAVLVALGAAGALAYPTGHKTGEAALAALTARAEVGVWRIDGASVFFDGPQAARNHLLLDGAADPAVVRVRLRSDNNIDAALLFRVREVQREPVLTFSGYGVFVNQTLKGGRGRIGFLRYDHGRAKSPEVFADIDGFDKERDVELVLMAHDAYFSAALYRTADKVLLATVTWSDPSYGGASGVGDIGVYAYRKGAPFRADIFTPQGAARVGPSGRAPIGAQWTLQVPADTALPDGPFRRVRTGDDDVETYITDEVGAQLVRDAHVEALTLRPGVAHALRAPDIYRRAQLRPTKTRRGLTPVPGLKDPAMVEQHLRALAATYPERTRLEEIGRSHEGRAIYALHIADDVSDAARPRVLLCAAHHALEAVTPEFPLDAAFELLNPHRSRRAQKRIDGYLAAFHVVIVPLVNVDGSHAFWHVDARYGRKNRRAHAGYGPDAYGVDLNRNYPFEWNNVEDGLNSSNPASPFYRGPSAGSEPAVQAMMALAERERPVALVSYHSAATKILVPYTVEGASNETPAVAWEIADTLVNNLPHTFGRRKYKAQRNLYPVGGVDQDWYMHTYGTMAYLVEVPWSRPSNAGINESVKHTRPVWTTLLNRYLDGPTLALRVVDDAGAPVAAEVRLTNVAFANAEVFSTDPQTGRFYRYVSETMPTLDVEVRSGKAVVTRSVKMERHGVSVVEIVLP